MNMITLASRFVRLLAAGSIAAVAQAAQAAWPADQPITVTVGFAAGGTTDVMVRTLAPFIAKHLGDGAQIAVLNRPGASGEIAIGQVMRARADGYSLVVVNLPGFYFVPMWRKASYATRDLTLVARVVRDPTVMVARRDGRAGDFRQMIAMLKAAPESLSAGHNGLGTNGHLAMVQLENAAGVKFNAVPFNGSAQQKLGLGSATLDIAFVAASEVDPDNEAAPVRLLAQFVKTRVPKLAGVPTTYELGHAVEMTAERGIAAPNGTPPEIVARLERAIEAAMKDPAYVKAARADAPFLDFLGGAAWTRQIEQDRKAYEEIARTLPRD